MTPVNPDSDSDDSQRQDVPIAFLGTSLEALQQRHASQLTQDIEQLEAKRSSLEAETELLQSQLATLREDYAQLLALTEGLQATNPEGLQPESAEEITTERIVPWGPGPLLPGESAPAQEVVADRRDRTIELPTPSTSEQRRKRMLQQQADRLPIQQAKINRGLVLSAIATTLAALHYCLFSTLAQGGSWFDLIEIGQLGTGFLSSTALLWLRMLVMVPGLMLLAPQLYRNTWDDLQEWMSIREQMLLPLAGSGIALFLSQVLLYQSIGVLGAAIGSALFFLYPLTAIPSGLILQQERSLTPFGVLALVAIAMGGLLIIEPAFTTGSANLIWTGLLASVALSLYILLTNFCYQQRCHPIPTSIAQFSTVAILSSLVLLVKPLQLVDLSWFSFACWGLLIGLLMLVAYLLNYASLLAVGPRTGIVAATTPLLTLLFSWSFTPAS
ncbi:MAG: hypothetical protein WA949_11165, partial [Phormidesmis sp.]